MTATVSTFDEWQAWARAEREPSPAYPEASAIGELAEQIRKRFGTEPDAPVRIIADMYDMATMQMVMNMICDGVNPRDVAVCRRWPDDYDWAAIRAWLDGDA